MVAIFTHDELGQFKLYQLWRLAEYYHLDHFKQLKKADLIDKLSEVLCADPLALDEDMHTQMSVRVRRIFEQNRGD